MVDITKTNFKEMFSSVENAVNKASFISIDAEFTGLYLDPINNSSLFDSLEERYEKLRQRASNFIPCQIGLSFFTKCENRNLYFVETYIFYIRPHHFGSIDRRFLCQASSYDFLSKYDFDFNKFAKEGIPYLNEDEEKIARKELNDKTLFYSHERMMDKNMKRNQELLISEFIIKSKENDTITFPLDTISHEYFQINAIRKKNHFLWAYKENTRVVIKKVSKKEYSELEKTIPLEHESLLEFFLGFTLIFRLLKDAKKPLIGHNVIMDLLLIYHNFHKMLPKSYKEFKEELHKIFPIIFDTRHIWLHIKKFCDVGKIPKQSGLFDLYTIFKSPPSLLQILFTPEIEHCNGNKYNTEEFPHDSGFDSYITGFVFLRICHLLAIKQIKNSELILPQSLKQHMKAVIPFKNKLNLSMSRIRFINLDGEDPLPDVKDLLFIRSKNSNELLNKMKLADVFGKYGMVELKLINNGKAAMAAVASLGCCRSILRDFNNDEELVVTRYDPFRHSFWAKTALWLVGLGSGCMTVFLIVKLIQMHK